MRGWGGELGTPDGESVNKQERPGVEMDQGADLWGAGRGWLRKDLQGTVENPSNAEASSPTPAQNRRSPTGVRCAHSWLFYTAWVDTL